MENIVVRTTIPILLLVGAGLASRKIGILKSGDERVLSALVYYFTLPALFLVNMAETEFTGETLNFMLAAISPILIVLPILIIICLILRLPKKTTTLLIVSTIFGSLAFFGIPFITFAFPLDGERLATLLVTSISIVSVTISISMLELWRLKETPLGTKLKQVARRLSKNPLIISIFIGILLSGIGVEIPSILSTSLHMLGSASSAVAIFMLGVTLYGRKYTSLITALKLMLLRAILLPMVAFLVTLQFSLPLIDRSAIIVMHGTPVAISLLILGERYDFYKETVASLVFISSLGAGLYLNLWLLLLGQS